MAIKVRSAGAADRWANRAAGASEDYKKGAMEAGGDWANNAAAAASTYRAAVAAGGIENRFANGVRKAGAGKYTQRVNTVGAARYSEGVNTSKDAYNSGVGPYLQVIQGLTLPARQLRGSAANNARSTAVSNALAARRVAQSGAGG